MLGWPMADERAEDPQQWREGAVTLRDQRQLAFVEAGDPCGNTLFWFHGLPGGRWQVPPGASAAARQHGLRIVCVSRPGLGGSSRHHEASLLSFADDIGELADELALERYAVVALSAGAPYALACAYRDPQRVVAGALLGGVIPRLAPATPGLEPFEEPQPSNSSADKLVARIARSLRPNRHLAAGLDLGAPLYARLAGPLFELYCRLGPRQDRPVLNQPDMKRMFESDFARSVGAGISGFLYDAAILASPCGFPLGDIVAPIRVWHGDADPLVPLGDAEQLARSMADGELRVLPGLGHYAGLVKAREVIADIATMWPS
jgi:pimeloyl-ACP methyl ester carboxylesterase